MQIQTSNALLTQINRELPRYSRAFRQLADCVLTQTFRVSSMSIDELAAAAGVSVATINRFSHQCGYDGYPPFRNELRRIYQSAMAPVEKLRQGMAREISEADIVRESFASAADNIARSRQLLQADAASQAVGMIIGASQVYIAGMGVSALHAAFAADCLDPYRAGIKEVSSVGGTERALRRVSMLGAKDLVIGITLPRYSRGIVDLLALARERRARILALTDAPTSPIVPLADIALFAMADHPQLYASNAAMIALIEGLSAAVAHRIGDSVETIAAQTEHILPYLYLDNTAFHPSTTSLKPCKE